MQSSYILYGVLLGLRWWNGILKFYYRCSVWYVYMWGHVYYSMSADIRVQDGGICSFFPPWCWLQGSICGVCMGSMCGICTVSLAGMVFICMYGLHLWMVFACLWSVCMAFIRMYDRSISHIGLGMVSFCCFVLYVWVKVLLTFKRE